MSHFVRKFIFVFIFLLVLSIGAWADSGLKSLQECASQGDGQCIRELKVETKGSRDISAESSSSQIDVRISSATKKMKIFFKHPLVIWNLPPLLLFLILLGYTLRTYDGDLFKVIHTHLSVIAFVGSIVGSLTLFILMKFSFAVFAGIGVAIAVGLICVACVTVADVMLLGAFIAKPQLRRALQKWGVVSGILGVTPIFTFFLGVALFGKM